MLLAGRSIQGVAGGGLIVLANICISDLFSMRYNPSSTDFDFKILINLTETVENILDWLGLSGASPVLSVQYLEVSLHRESHGAGASTSIVCQDLPLIPCFRPG